MSENTITKKLPLKTKDKLAAAALSLLFIALLTAMTFIKTELIDERQTAHNLSMLYRYLIMAGIFIISFIILAFYMSFSFREGIKQKRVIGVVGTSIVLNYLFCLIASHFSIYLIPLCFAGVVIANLIEPRLGFAVNLICVLQTLAYVLLIGGNPDMIVAETVMAVCSIVYALIALGRINRNTGRADFIGYLLLFSIIIAPVTFLLALFCGTDIAAFWSDAVYIAGGIVAQILLVLFFIPLLELIFMITTNSRLAELCDLRQPLLKRLMTEAPATFNHSQTVSNLAESCASALNENIYMARAAALYHDIGKLSNVEYFTENQISGKNPHDEITPELSAEIIHQHTGDGYKMAVEARVPKDLAAITTEHHGTTVLKYFYDKARRMTDGEVDPDFYRYKGNKPTTKIAAIIMICDGSEAAIRAMPSPNMDKVSALVESIINDRIEDGQFDNCEITMKDLAIIRQTIAEMSTGLYHTRIEYPKS